MSPIKIPHEDDIDQIIEGHEDLKAQLVKAKEQNKLLRKKLLKRASGV
jgi:hypothetical protein